MIDYINSEIAKIEAKLIELKNLVNPPIESRGDFCVKINNRESHFGDFMDWIKERDYDFYKTIVFTETPFVSFKDGCLSKVYIVNVQQLSVNDWWNKFGFHNLVIKIVNQYEGLSKKEREELIKSIERVGQ